jgi:hypothetical protein
MKQAFSDRLPVPKTFQECAISKPDCEFRERYDHKAESGRFRENPINEQTQSIDRRQYDRGIEQHRVES